MSINYQQRMKMLLETSNADVVALVPGANMVYFTGLHFHLMERPTIALVSQEGLSMIIPGLEIPKLQQRPDLEARSFAWSDEEGYANAFQKAIDDLQLADKSVHVDGMTMRVFEWLAFKNAGAAVENFADAGQVLLGIRAIKISEEVEAMRCAVQISEEALKRTVDWVKPGMSEREIADKLTIELKNGGSEGKSFEPLVQTGPRSALPHGDTSERKLADGEILLIDFGGTYHEYPADITRTFVMGEPSDKIREIYDIVLQANLAAQKVAGPGVPCGKVDKAARDVIEAAGYGEYFFHRLGHGLGLEVHELPQMASDVETPLEVGMVFTIEPGIYIPDFGGVRIEDNVVVTEDGIDVLTSYPRELISLSG